MTMLSFSGDKVWDDLVNVLKRPAVIRAAIAYAGPLAPQLLPLRKGDLIISKR